MTHPVQPTREVGPASSPQPPNKKRPPWVRWYLWLPVGILLVIAIVSALAFNHLANPSTQPAGSSGQGHQTAPATSVPTTSVPTSPAEQAQAFYAPGSFVAQHLAAYTADGGDSWKGHATDDNDKIVANFNYWWQVGCRTPSAWQQVLWGIVDVHSHYYQQWLPGADDAPQCAFPFEGGYGGSDVGTNPRIVGMKVGSQPGNGVQAYTFVFVPNPAQPSVGVWLLSDSASSAPAATQVAPTSPSLSQQVSSFYESPAVIAHFSAAYNNGSEEMGKKTWTNAQIVASFNDWVNRSCVATTGRLDMLKGIVDASSTYWATYTTEVPDCNLLFRPPSAEATGTSRVITLEQVAQPGSPHPYHFVFVTNPDNTFVGAWLLTDGG